MGLGGQRHTPATLRSEAYTFCTEGLAVPMVGLDLCRKSRPACSESLYLLYYRTHISLCNVSIAFIRL